MDIVPPSRPRGSHVRLSSRTNVAVTLPVLVPKFLRSLQPAAALLARRSHCDPWVCSTCHLTSASERHLAEMWLISTGHSILFEGTARRRTTSPRAGVASC